MKIVFILVSTLLTGCAVQDWEEFIAFKICADRGVNVLVSDSTGVICTDGYISSLTP